MSGLIHFTKPIEYEPNNTLLSKLLSRSSQNSSSIFPNRHSSHQNGQYQLPERLNRTGSHGKLEHSMKYSVINNASQKQMNNSLSNLNPNRKIHQYSASSILANSQSQSHMRGSTLEGREPRSSHVFSKLNNLDNILKNIRQCNKQSSKAVYQIKRTTMDMENQEPYHGKKAGQGDYQLYLDEIRSLKAEITQVKKENQQLKHWTAQGKGCPTCGCICRL